MGARYREYLQSQKKGKTVINMGGSASRNVAPEIDAAIAEIFKGIGAIAGELEDGKFRNQALFTAASTLRDTMYRRAPRAKRNVHRYINGKKVATYTVGNLQRSVKILTHMADKKSYYVGIEVPPRMEARGVFSGSSKVDGWYAHFVEYGPRKRPFIRPSVMEAGPDALRVMGQYVKAILARANSK